MQLPNPTRPAVDALFAALKDVAPEIGVLPSPTRASLLKREAEAAIDELERFGFPAAAQRP
jgi:hypothetical protein